MPRFKILRHLALTVLLTFITTTSASADESIRSAILTEINSGRILRAQNVDLKIPPASLAKIMTLYVAMDSIKTGKAKLSDQVKISALAAKQSGARMHLKTGEIVSLDKLLTGVAVSSGNDASVAVAEHIAGSERGFVRLMNAKAKELGMKQTTFRNPHGLNAKGQITSARDMLTLSQEYIKNHPEALHYHGILSLTHRGVTSTNKNALLKSCPGADGLKTGWIVASGFNLIFTVKRNNTRLLGVILGASSPKALQKEARHLIESYFSK